MTNFQKAFGQNRLLSMALDHLIMTFFMMILFLPASVIFHSKNPQVIGSVFRRIQDSILFFSYASLLISIYLNKDCYQGRSPAKRITNFQVIDVRTGKSANPLKCAIRNVTVLIWPIEVIMTLLNSNRRIGDFIAGTSVVLYDKQHEVGEQNWVLTGISILSTWLLVFLIGNLPSILK